MLLRHAMRRCSAHTSTSCASFVFTLPRAGAAAKTAASPSRPTRVIPAPPFTRSAWGTAARAPAPVQLAYDVIDPVEDKRPGENLVICHGLFGSKQNWRTLARRFSKELGMKVYTVDLRNHGQSPHAEPHTSAAMAEDLAYLFRREGMEKVHLVGHSMGGKAVMALALNSDLNGRLASLVPVDMSPAVEPIEDQYNGYAKGMKEISAAHVHSRHEADHILEKYEPLLSTRQFLLTNAITTTTPEGKKVLDFRIPLDILADAIPKLGQFPYTPPPPVGPTSPQWTGPVLFLRGGKADYIRPDNIGTCEAFFPNMSLITLDAGHWVHAEKPKETGDAIIEFIKNVEVKWDKKAKRMEGGVEWLD